MALPVLWAAIYLVIPAAVIYAPNRLPILRGVQPVITCYLLGLMIGNLGVLPADVGPLQDSLSSVAVAFSVPLMLFGLDLRSLKRLSPRAGLALLLAAAAIVVVASAGHVLFRSSIAESEKVSGLLVGVYTGGTPNLAALKNALEVESSLYITVHTADLVVGGIYLLFVITVAKGVFSRFLPAFDVPEPVAGGSVDNRRADDASESRTPEPMRFGDIYARENRRTSLAALGLAAVLVAASLGIAMLFPPNAETIVVILALTTLSIGASLLHSVKRLRAAFKLGEYIILVFCVVVGSMANVGEMLAASPAILGFVAFAVFGSFGLHLLLCRLFHVDVDTMLVTSTAAICSPPFVGLVAIAIDNRRLIAAGITTGIAGYAIGNYLGVAISLALSAL